MFFAERTFPYLTECLVSPMLEKIGELGYLLKGSSRRATNIFSTAQFYLQWSALGTIILPDCNLHGYLVNVMP